MGLAIYDLAQLYRYQFGGRPFVIGKEQPSAEAEPFVINADNVQVSQVSGSALTENYLGKEIWLPVKFLGLDASVFGVDELLLPYSVIKISSSKTIVSTPLSERRGTVKEYFSAEDYQITIKGFVIDEADRIWPEKELIVLKQLDDLTTAIQLDNALTNIFLDKDTRVVISKLDLPEVEGGRKHIRPFSMTLMSDSIFTLDVADNV
jgi:Domain of unknown function (DUF6046)